MLFEMGLNRLFSVSPAVNYVAPRTASPSREPRPRDAWPLPRDGVRHASDVLMLSCDALKLSLTYELSPFWVSWLSTCTASGKHKSEQNCSLI